MYNTLFSDLNIGSENQGVSYKISA